PGRTGRLIVRFSLSASGSKPGSSPRGAAGARGSPRPRLLGASHTIGAIMALRFHALRPFPVRITLFLAAALAGTAVHGPTSSARPSSADPARPALVPDPDDGGLKLPEGFRARVVADELGPLRFLTVAPNGDVFVKTRDKGIIALRDTDGDG